MDPGYRTVRDNCHVEIQVYNSCNCSELPMNNNLLFFNVEAQSVFHGFASMTKIVARSSAASHEWDEGHGTRDVKRAHEWDEGHGTRNQPLTTNH